MIENAILGSAAVVLVWSSAAAQADWVERHLLFAQQLKKSLYAVALDQTPLPTTLVSISPITIQTSCADAVALLMALPGFPSPHYVDPLIRLYEQAAEMLKRDEDREAVLALLEYLAKNDLMMGLREKAQEVIEADAHKGTPPPPLLAPQDARHIFGVRCKNGHVSYFDKRLVCTAYRNVPRDLVQRAGKALDELHLKCDTCKVEVIARVDCGDYK